MATLTVTVAGVDRTAYLCGPGAGNPATFDEALRERRRFSCEFLDRTGAWYPIRGQGITVTHSTEGVIFGGYLSIATRRKAPGSDAIFTKITAVSYEQIMNRRLSIAFTWTGQVAGGIFNQIIEDSLIDEGFTTETETGPTIPLFDIQEPRPTVRDALDRLCELASNGNDIYYWDASPTKVARFFKQDTYPAPFAITDANPDVLESLAASVDETNQGIVNRVFVYLGQYLRDSEMQAFVGDSSTRVFLLDYPVGAVPALTLNTVAVDPADVGVENVDTGKKWYWSLGSSQIRQDDAETILTAGDDLEVTYQGLERRATEPFNDADSENAEGVLQGDGTGIYEAMLTIDDPATYTDAATLAQSWLDRYSTATVTFQGSTYTAGLRSGQELIVDLTSLGIDLTMLIQSVTMTDSGAGRFLWTFSAIYGAARDDWKKSLLGTKPSTSISGAAAGPQGLPGEAATGTPAPNVTATGDVFYEPWANSQNFGFSGVITLPTGHADYAHLKQIDVLAVDPDDGAHVVAIFRDISGATLDYSGVIGEQPSANENWTLKFVVRNESGAASDTPYTIGPITVEAAGLTSVTGAEVGPVYQDPIGHGLHTVIEIIPVVANSQLPMVATIWIDFDDGRGDIWQGWWTLETGGQEITLGSPTVGTEGQPLAGHIWVPVDPTQATWTVKAAAGAINKGAAIPAGYVSDAFTVATAAAAVTSDVTNAFFTNDPVTGVPIVYTKDGRAITWHFYQLSWSQPSITAKPWFKNSFLTVQKGAIISGTWTPAPDREGVDEDPAGQFLGRRVTDGGDPLEAASTVIYRGTTWPDWTYPPNNNPDRSPNLYRTFRFRIYSQSRRGENPTGGAGVIALNTCWPGGANYFDLTPGPQPAAVSGALEGGEGDPIIITAKGITEPYIGDQAIIARTMAANSITAANSAIAANTIVDGQVIDVGVAKLLHGTKIFTGDVILSRGSSAPVIVLNNSAINLFGQADGGGSGGLTSKPYVSIASAGITVFSGANPSVTITSAAVTLWSVNGNTSNPHVLISSAGAALVNGLNSVAISAAGLTISDSGGAYISATSTQITLSKGGNSVTISTNGLTISDASGAYLSGTSGQLTLVRGASSVTLTAGGLTIANGSSQVSVTPTSVTITNGVLLSPSITVSGSGFVVNIDQTNAIRVSFNGIITQIFSVGVFVYEGNIFTGIKAPLVDSGGAGLLSLYQTAGNPTVSISASGGGSIYIGGQQVLSTRYGGTPTTLAEAIDVLQHHGLCN